MLSYNSLTTEFSALVISGHQLDMQMQSIQVGNKLVRLRNKLWQVLLQLVQNQNQLVPRQALIDFCWQGNAYTGEQGVTHTICHLRRIFKKYGIAAKIITIPKRGYVLEDNSTNLSNESFKHSVKLGYNIESYEESGAKQFLFLAN